MNELWQLLIGLGVGLLGAIGFGAWKRSVRRRGAQAQHQAQHQAAVEVASKLTEQDAKISAGIAEDVEAIRERTRERLGRDPTSAEIEETLGRWGE